QANVRAFIDVAGSAVRRDTDIAQAGDGLRAPRRTWLAIAGESVHAQDAAHVGCAAAFATGKLLDSIEQLAVGQILGGSGVNRVVICVVADIVFLQRGDYVPAPTLFEDARFFADKLE